jgi:hypothetical protein
VVRHRKNSNSVIATPRQLDKLIEEATVDCYNGEEQASGFFAMIEENLTLPFRTCILALKCRWSQPRWIMMAASKPYASAPANSNVSI